MIMGSLVKNDAVIALFFSANYFLNVYPKYVFITFDKVKCSILALNLRS